MTPHLVLIGVVDRLVVNDITLAIFITFYTLHFVFHCIINIL